MFFSVWGLSLSKIFEGHPCCSLPMWCEAWQGLSARECQRRGRIGKEEGRDDELGFWICQVELLCRHLVEPCNSQIVIESLRADRKKERRKNKEPKTRTWRVFQHLHSWEKDRLEEKQEKVSLQMRQTRVKWWEHFKNKGVLNAVEMCRLSWGLTISIGLVIMEAVLVLAGAVLAEWF